MPSPGNVGVTDGRCQQPNSAVHYGIKYRLFYWIFLLKCNPWCALVIIARIIASLPSKQVVTGSNPVGGTTEILSN